jgi:diacylglycerol kinase
MLDTVVVALRNFRVTDHSSDCLVVGTRRRRAGIINRQRLFVIVVELINSAIESVVDRIGREHDELSGRAKDLGAAAVFCSIVTAMIIWGVLLGHR